MRRVNIFFQEIIKIFAIFLFFFVWLRYFVHKFWLSSLYSTLCTALFYAILIVIKRKKKRSQGLKMKEKEDAENMFLSLACQTNPMQFFEKLLSKKHKDVSAHKNYVTAHYPHENEKILLWFDGSFSGLDVSKLVEIYNKTKKENATKVIVCCRDISDKNVFGFSANFKTKFVILNQYETYEKLFKQYDFYPEVTQTFAQEKKMMFKDFVAYSFNKKRTKGYLFSAFVLILSGVFVRATIYYCLVSSILLLFALISWFNPFFNQKKEEVI